jgi:GNAT superfamily N-acetyltransferase
MTAPADIPTTTAGPGDIGRLCGVIASAFLELPPSRWLIPDPAGRHAAFPSYFRLLLELAIERGQVITTHDRSAAALWIPSGTEPLPDYDERLAVIAGDRLPHFRAFDIAMEEHHPRDEHDWLAILAVRPGLQGKGIGSALLHARHRQLDTLGTGAYLEAASQRARALYLRHGYADAGDPIQLPAGPPMWPMWRDPQPLPGAGPVTDCEVLAVPEMTTASARHRRA